LQDKDPYVRRAAGGPRLGWPSATETKSVHCWALREGDSGRRERAVITRDAHGVCAINCRRRAGISSCRKQSLNEARSRWRFADVFAGREITGGGARFFTCKHLKRGRTNRGERMLSMLGPMRDGTRHWESWTRWGEIVRKKVPPLIPDVELAAFKAVEEGIRPARGQR